MLQKYF